jgi:hypothetical protein
VAVAAGAEIDDGERLDVEVSARNGEQVSVR